MKQLSLFKRCSLCGAEHPATIEHFRRKGDGLEARCKRCRADIDRAYRLENSVRLNEQNAQWRKNNMEHIKQKHKEYYERNRVRILECASRWQKDNRERRREICRVWRQRHVAQDRTYAHNYRKTHPNHVRDWMQANPDKARRIRRTQKVRRKALIRNALGSFTTKQISKMHDEQQGCCAYCSAALNGYYEIEHVIPLSRGGSNHIENIALVCRSCNRQKNNRMLYSEWTPPHPLERFQVKDDTLR